MRRAGFILIALAFSIGAAQAQSVDLGALIPTRDEPAMM